MPASQPDRVKSAATYLLQGKVQGVGLRKKLHRILDDLNRPGLAFNNARTGEVLASIPGRARQREKVLKLLAERMAEEGLVEGEDYRVTPLTKRVASQPVTLDEEAIRRFSELQGFTRLPQAPLEYQKKWLKDRYRLQEDDSGALVGRVPELARRQLLEGEPVYDYQLVPGWADTPTKTAGHVKLAAGLGRLISQALRGARPRLTRSALGKYRPQAGLAGLGTAVFAAGKLLKSRNQPVFRPDNLSKLVDEGQRHRSTAVPGTITGHDPDALRRTLDRHLGPRYKQPLAPQTQTLPIARAIHDLGVDPNRFLRQFYADPVTYQDWRTQLAQEMEHRRFRGGVDAPASYRMLRDAVERHGMPPITQLDPDDDRGAFYSYSRGSIGIAPPEALSQAYSTLVRAHGHGGILRHELEHDRQSRSELARWLVQQAGSRGQFHGPGAGYYYGLVTASNELPAVLGDVSELAERFRIEQKRPLNSQITWPSGARNHAEWISRQARQHGFPQRSMTELLSTEPGLRWLRQRLDLGGAEPSYPPAGETPHRRAPYQPLPQPLATLLQSRDLTPEQRAELLREMMSHANGF